MRKSYNAMYTNKTAIQEIKCKNFILGQCIYSGQYTQFAFLKYLNNNMDYQSLITNNMFKICHHMYLSISLNKPFKCYKIKCHLFKWN